MSKAENGNTVRVHYRGTLEDGSVFDSSYERNEPFELTLGAGMAIAGFEKAVLGLSIGEKVDVAIPPEEAYGERMDDLTVEVMREKLPDDMEPQEGMILEVSTGEDSIAATITEIKDDLVTLDANHPLAGKELKFQIELLEIVNA